MLRPEAQSATSTRAPGAAARLIPKST